MRQWIGFDWLRISSMVL